MDTTEEQIKEFWEYFGFNYERGRYSGWWRLDNETFAELPPIDLNNLFKWAVPKLGLPSYIKFTNLGNSWGASIVNKLSPDIYDQDPAHALFWAIYKVLEVA